MPDTYQDDEPQTTIIQDLIRTQSSPQDQGPMPPLGALAQAVPEFRSYLEANQAGQRRARQEGTSDYRGFSRITQGERPIDYQNQFYRDEHWEKLQEELRRDHPGLDDDSIARIGDNYRESRQRTFFSHLVGRMSEEAANRQNRPIFSEDRTADLNRWSAHRLPFIGQVASFVESIGLGNSARRIGAGQGTVHDYEDVTDHLARIEAEKGHGFFQKTFDLLTHLPGFAAEMASGGWLAKAGLKAAGMGGAYAAGATSRLGMIGRAQNWGRGVIGGLPGAAVTGLIQGPAIAAQQGIPEINFGGVNGIEIMDNGEWYRPDHLIRAYGEATVMAGIGRAAIPRLLGEATPGIVGILQNAGGAVLEMRAADVLMGVTGIKTDFGTLGQLWSSKTRGGAIEQMVSEALAFGIFGTMMKPFHEPAKIGGKPVPGPAKAILENTAKTLDAIVKNEDVTPEVAARQMSEVHQVIDQALQSPQVTHAEVKRQLERQFQGGNLARGYELLDSFFPKDGPRPTVVGAPAQPGVPAEARSGQTRIGQPSVAAGAHESRGLTIPPTPTLQSIADTMEAHHLRAASKVEETQRAVRAAEKSAFEKGGPERVDAAKAALAEAKKQLGEAKKSLSAVRDELMQQPPADVEAAKPPESGKPPEHPRNPMTGGVLDLIGRQKDVFDHIQDNLRDKKVINTTFMPDGKVSAHPGLKQAEEGLMLDLTPQEKKELKKAHADYDLAEPGEEKQQAIDAYNELTHRLIRRQIERNLSGESKGGGAKGPEPVSRKQRRNNLNEHLLDLPDEPTEGQIAGAFRKAGYVDVDGFMVHPDVDQAWVKNLSPKVKELLRENGVVYFEPVGEHGAASAESIQVGNRKLRGIGVNEKIDAPNMRPESHEHYVIHELGHHVWQNDLTAEQRSNWHKRELTTQYAKDVRDSKAKTLGSPHEEEFAEKFGHNKGDLEKTLADTSGKIGAKPAAEAPPFPHGWKLHLTTDNPEAVSKILTDLGLKHKVGRNSGQEGKDLTVYVGSMETAKEVAAKIEEAAGNHLKEPTGDAAKEDRMFTKKVAGRFDIGGHDREFHQYGSERGIPWLNSDMDLFNRRPGATERAEAVLKERYGEFYEGKPDSGKIGAKPAAGKPTALERLRRGQKGDAATKPQPAEPPLTEEQKQIREKVKAEKDTQRQLDEAALDNEERDIPGAKGRGEERTKELLAAWGVTYRAQESGTPKAKNQRLALMAWERLRQFRQNLNLPLRTKAMNDQLAMFRELFRVNPEAAYEWATLQTELIRITRLAETKGEIEPIIQESRFADEIKSIAKRYGINAEALRRAVESSVRQSDSSAEGGAPREGVAPPGPATTPETRPASPVAPAPAGDQGATGGGQAAGHELKHSAADIDIAETFRAHDELADAFSDEAIAKQNAKDTKNAINEVKAKGASDSEARDIVGKTVQLGETHGAGEEVSPSRLRGAEQADADAGKNAEDTGGGESDSLYHTPGAGPAAGLGGKPAPRAADLIRTISHFLKVAFYNVDMIHGNPKATGAARLHPELAEIKELESLKPELYMHEAAHIVAKRLGFDFDPTGHTLDPQVAEGFRQFQGQHVGNTAVKMTKEAIQEGFAQWLVRRMKGGIWINNLTKDMQVAAEHGEQWLQSHQGLKSALDHIQPYFEAFYGQTRTQELGGQINDTGKPGQVLGQATGQKVKEAAVTAGEKMNERLHDDKAVLHRMWNELVAKFQAKGHSLESARAAAGADPAIQARALRYESHGDAAQTMDHGYHALEQGPNPNGDPVARWGQSPDKGFDANTSLLKKDKHGVIDQAERKAFNTFADAMQTNEDWQVEDMAREKARNAGEPEDKGTVTKEQYELARDVLIEMRNKDQATFDRYHQTLRLLNGHESGGGNAAGMRWLGQIGYFDKAWVEKELAERPYYVSRARVFDQLTEDFLQEYQKTKRPGAAAPAMQKARSQSGAERRGALETFEERYNQVAAITQKHLLNKAFLDLMDKGMMGDWARRLPEPKPEGPNGERPVQGEPDDPLKRIWTARENGQSVRMEIKNNALWEYLTNTQGAGTASVKIANAIGSIPILSWIPKIIKKGAVGFQPIWHATGMWPTRDAKQFITNSMNPKSVVDLPGWWAGWTDFIMHGALSEGKAAKPYIELLENLSGDRHRWVVGGGDPGEVAKGRGSFGKSYAIDGIGGVAKELLRRLSYPELVPKARELKNALDAKGINEETVKRWNETGERPDWITQAEIMNAALDVTHSQLYQGVDVRAWSHVIPFFGAHVANNGKWIRNFRDNPKMAALGIASTLGMALAYWAWRKDDKAYQEAPVGSRNNFFIPTPFGEMKIAGPRGFDVPIMALADEMLRSASRSNPHFDRVAPLLLQQVIPGAPEPYSTIAQQATGRTGPMGIGGYDLIPRQDQNQGFVSNTIQHRIPHLAEHFTGGMIGARNPVLTAITGRPEPHQSVNDYYDQLHSLEAARTQARARGAAFPEEGQYQRLHYFSRYIQQLQQELRGEVHRGGRVYQVGRPSAERERAIRAQLLDLTRQALGR